MKTVLEIAQTYCYRSNLPAPSSLFGSTDPAALQLLHLIYEVCEELREKGGWAQTKKVHTFDLETSKTFYQLPKDFYAPVIDTQWQTDQQRRMKGPVSDAVFTRLKYRSIEPSDLTYRIWGPDMNPNSAGGQFEVRPTPKASGDSQAFEYYTRNLFLPKHWAASTAYTSGVYVNNNGYNYLCDTNGTSGSTGPSGTDANITDGSTRWDYYGEAYETIKADTDLCMYDDNLVILGLKYKWKDAKGEDFTQAQANFYNGIEIAKGRLNAPVVGSMTGDEDVAIRYSVPDSDWF